MVRVKEDMTGWKMWEHGVPDSRLTVVEQTEDYVAPNGKHHAQWRCKCLCGNNADVISDGHSIKYGKILSCGCLKKIRQLEVCKKYNEYKIDGDIVVGFTSNTNKPFYVDLKNFDKIRYFCWYESIDKGMSALKTHIPKTSKIVSMHHMLGFENCDHKDRNELNNLESNMRLATIQENARNHNKQKNNTSGVTGVGWLKQQSKWRAYIYINKEHVYLGVFDNKDDAIKARLYAEKEYFGEFAPQKHLYEQYGITDNVNGGDTQ